MSVEDPVRPAKLRGLRDNFPYYACHCMKVRSKSGAIVPFKLNAVQRRVHEAAERQMARAGRIRILVLKARQPGFSTYVEGRFYWKTTRRTGVRAFILTPVTRPPNYIVHPWFGLRMLPLPPDMWELLKIGVGGYVVGRSVEKGVKVWRQGD